MACCVGVAALLQPSAFNSNRTPLALATSCGQGGAEKHTCAARDDSAREKDPPPSAEMDGAGADVTV